MTRPALKTLTAGRALAGVAAFCFLFALGTPAWAGLDSGDAEMGVDLGLTDFDDNVADDKGARFSVRAGYFFTDHFELEAQVVGQTVDEGPFDLTYSSVFVNAVFNFHPSERIEPYILGGVGYTELEVDSFDFTASDSAFASQVAVGSRWYFRPGGRVALRTEVGLMFEETFNDSSTHGSVSVGLTWKLGG